MCQEYRASNQKEPMIPGPTPKHPWEEIATDLFHWSDHDYLIIVDYFSRYIELCKLDDTSSKSIVTHTKSVLARHGIPMVIRSDNGHSTQLKSTNVSPKNGVSSTRPPVPTTHRLMDLRRKVCSNHQVLAEQIQSKQPRSIPQSARVSQHHC